MQKDLCEKSPSIFLLEVPNWYLKLEKLMTWVFKMIWNLVSLNKPIQNDLKKSYKN